MIDEKYIARAIFPHSKRLLERLESAGVDAAKDRWGEGLDHHPKSEALMQELVDLDWVFFDDYFGWKTGGDGDNGETLMFMLDVLFELYDKEQEVDHAGDQS